MKRRRCGDMPVSGEIFGHRTLNEQTTSKPQVARSRKHGSWLSVFSLLYFSVNIEARQSLDLECYELLQQKRHSHGFELGAADYATVVSGMTHGNLEPLFDQLPRNFYEHFRIRAAEQCRYHQDWGYCIDMQSSRNAVPTFCQEIRSEIEASMEGAPSPAMLSRSPTIYPSTKAEGQEIAWSSDSLVGVSPSSTFLEGIHRDRRLQSLQDCKINISIADADRSNRLRKAEYVVFLNRMSKNQFAGGSFAELPQRFQDYFENNKGTGGIDVAGARPGQTPTTAQTDSLTKLCDDTTDLINTSNAPVGQPTGGGGGPTSPPAVDCDGTIAERQCFIALSISDRNRDDLLQEDDYIRFVNRLSDNDYVDVDQLGQLPSKIQSNYRNLENNGAINISGSKPGQSASKAQSEFLSRVCCETDLAIQNPGDVGPPSVGPNPTIAPVGPQCVSTITRQQCNIYLSIADLSKDNFLNQVEYVRFLDRLSKTGDFNGVPFSSLPAPFIANYVNFATVEDQIDVFGSKPGQTASASQNEFVNKLCCETNRLVEGGAPPPTPVPTDVNPAPSVSQEPSNAPSTVPSRPLSSCFQSLQEADLFKDSFLSTTEFVRLVILLGGNTFEGIQFEKLPCQLIATFGTLSSDGGTIPIIGATSPTATEEQKQQALNVCAEVTNSIMGQGADECSSPPSISPDVSESPSGSPSTSPPTAGPIDGTIEIFNAFVILNTRGIVAERLEPGTLSRIGLDAAYDAFVTESVGRAIASGPALSSSLRGWRRLNVILQQESSSVYNIVDVECPVNQIDATCQVGYGRFRIDVTNEYAIQIIETYTNFTQNDILNGLLQSSLEREDPNSVLQIVDVFFPVRDPNEPTNPPATNPPQTSTGPVDESSNTGAIVGGVIGGLLLCAICLAIGWFANKGKDPKAAATGGDDDNDDNSVIGENQNDDDKSTRENLFDNLKNRFKDDDEEDSDQEEDNEFNAFSADFKDTTEEADEKVEVKEKEKTNIFGFGKKEKKNKEADIFGVVTTVDSDSSSAENDFGKYGFEDPDALLGDGDDDDEDGDDEDDAGSKEELFENNVSPAWATSETGFGASWGAGGSNDLANEFFSKSFGSVDLAPDTAEGNAMEAAPEKGTLEDDDEDDDEEDSQSQSSFGSSEDSTYESNNDDTEGYAQNEADNSTSADNDPDNSSSADSAEEEAEDETGWADQSAESTESEDEDEDDLSEQDDDDDDTYDRSQYSGSIMSASSRTSTTGEHQKRIEYQAQVDALVRIVLPDQMEKVAEMMDQFRGREPELISTLQNMQERSATQRARAAVHRTKTRPDRIETRAGGSYAGAENMMGASEGSAAGTAAIAAASLPIPAGGFDEAIPEDEEVGFGGGNAFGDYSREEDQNSFFSGDHSMERDSYNNDEPGYDDDSQDRSYEDQNRNFSVDQDHSFGDDPSQDRSYDDEDSRGSSFSGDDDMGDAFGGQVTNTFGSHGTDAFDSNAFASQGQNAFGDDNAFGGNAFGSQDDNAFGSPDGNAFGGDAFGSQGQDAFGNQDAFGSNPFGSSAFGADDHHQADNQGFGDDQDHSQGSYSQDQSTFGEDDRGRPNDQGFGDDQDYSQGTYSQDQSVENGNGRLGHGQDYSEGSFSQDLSAFEQSGNGRLGHGQGRSALGRNGSGRLGHNQDYSQGSSPNSFGRNGSGRLGHNQDYSQGSSPNSFGRNGSGRLGHGQGRSALGRNRSGRLGHDQEYSQGGSPNSFGRNGSGRLGHNQDYSQGSYSQDQSAFEQHRSGRLGHGQDHSEGSYDHDFGDEGSYSQGSYSEDRSQGSYTNSHDGEGQSFEDYDEESRSYYSGEEGESFNEDGFDDSENPDSFGNPPDSFGRGDEAPDGFGAGGWPDD